ncbi:MAG TPA: 50S ribosomal protein L35 [Elusimicrobiales bacterium]|nr:50S ribosomal protein L35 [Elusimicrobiales bacterium]
MPKMKNHSGAKKRFRKTATGKYTCRKAGLRHLLTPMSSGKGRQMRRGVTLRKTESEIVRLNLPYQ